ncbi:Uncharacterised protein [Mycobacteroides abscessus subsp. abscessus]|nr:Uncharacterised protein [Mycobacteroides abscessus subsp. abscessus]
MQVAVHLADNLAEFGKRQRHRTPKVLHRHLERVKRTAAGAGGDLQLVEGFVELRAQVVQLAAEFDRARCCRSHPRADRRAQGRGSQ